MNRCRLFTLVALCLALAHSTFAQTSTQAATALPRLIRFGGAVKDVSGNPLAGVAGVTFALYSEQTGGAPLWLETQNITADSNGRYTALLGATRPDGLPAELFISEQARWVGVQVQGQPEQPRVLLVSAPYALKAGDAETVGGLPPSAFVLAEPSARGPATASGPAAVAAGSRDVAKGTTDVTTTGGTANYLPLFTGASTILDSVVYQTGTGSTANIGINTKSPTSTLDVQGTGTFSSSTSNGVSGASSAVNQSGVFGSNSATSSSSNGVYGITSSPSGSGTVGVNSSSGGHGVFGKAEGAGGGSTGVFGNATNSSTSGPTYGVYGTTAGTSEGSAGVYGTAPNSSATAPTYGVYGTSAAVQDFEFGAGVFGGALTISGEGHLNGGEAGVWGDAGPYAPSGALNVGFGVQGTADDNIAIWALNNTSTDTTTSALYASNYSTTPGALVFQAAGQGEGCTIDNLSNLSCAGTITPSVRTSEGRDVKLYGVASSENWFEDFGSGQLSGGSVQIPLDPAFASTVNTGETYHVFLTPRGECEGLYVGSTTASGFEVRELHSGTSNISFDYRIVAKRRGYESVRLEDVTEHMNKMRQRQAEMQARRAGRKISAPPAPAAPEPAPGVAQPLQPARALRLNAAPAPRQ